MNRMKEPSTWAGLASIAAGMLPVFGVPAAIVAGVAGLFGGVAVWLREKSANA